MKRIVLCVGALILFGMEVLAEDEALGPDAARSEWGLEVTTYASSSDSIQFKWPTHMAFGPGNQEIVSDLKNSRFVFRDSPGDPFQISPVSLSGQHSVVYNPADKLYYANDTDNHRIISFADLSSETIAPPPTWFDAR